MIRTNLFDEYTNDFSERIKLLLDYLKISRETFCKNCGLSSGTLIKGWLSGEYEPSAESLRKIHRRYPDLSENWLHFGKGDMWQGVEYFQNRFELYSQNTVTAKEKIEALLNIYECSYSELGKHLGFTKNFIYGAKVGTVTSIPTKVAAEASTRAKFIPMEWFKVK